MMRRALAFCLLALAPAGCTPPAAGAPEDVARAQAVMVPKGDGGSNVSEKDESSPGPPQPLPPPSGPSKLGLVLAAAPRYLIGFPMWVSVTYDNRSGPAAGGLPDLKPWAVPDPRIGYRLLDSSGRVAAEHAVSRPLHESSGITLDAGEVRRGIVDLSNYTATLKPGAHRMTFLVMQHGAVLESPPVPVELDAPPAGDAQAASSLKNLVPDARASVGGAFGPFLTRLWETPVVSPALGAEAKTQLGLLLFYHRAMFGPEGPAQIDPARLHAITGPHQDAEVLALRYELAASRGHPDAPKLRAELISRYPGMEHRAAAIDAGEGLITHFRKNFGAESGFASRFPKLPYVP